MQKTRWIMVLLLVTVLGCPGGYDAPPDTKSGTDQYGPVPDWPQQPPDGPRMPDYYPQSPDTRQPDTRPWSPDTGYWGTPFGCQQDSDCFGRKCCPTPWGVKLCADLCRP